MEAARVDFRVYPSRAGIAPSTPSHGQRRRQPARRRWPGAPDEFEAQSASASEAVEAAHSELRSGGEDLGVHCVAAITAPCGGGRPPSPRTAAEFSSYLSEKAKAISPDMIKAACEPDVPAALARYQCPVCKRKFAKWSTCEWHFTKETGCRRDVLGNEEAATGLLQEKCMLQEQQAPEAPEAAEAAEAAGAPVAAEAAGAPGAAKAEAPETDHPAAQGEVQVRERPPAKEGGRRSEGRWVEKLAGGEWVERSGGGGWVEKSGGGEWLEKSGGGESRNWQAAKDEEMAGRWVEKSGGGEWVEKSGGGESRDWQAAKDEEMAGRWVEKSGGDKWVEKSGGGESRDWQWAKDEEMAGRWVEKSGGGEWVEKSDGGESRDWQPAKDEEMVGQWVEKSCGGDRDRGGGGNSSAGAAASSAGAARKAQDEPEKATDYTTVMLRNIPNKFTLDMLLKQLKVDFDGEFDFMYLPIDFKNGCNVGYCFINFRTCESCANFVSMFHGVDVRKCLPGMSSRKVVEVTRARVQGLQENIHRLRNSPVMNQRIEHPEWMPLLFDERGDQKEFSMPDQPLSPLKPRRPLSPLKPRGRSWAWRGGAGWVVAGWGGAGWSWAGWT